MWHFLRVMAGVDQTFAVLSGEDTLFPLQIAAGAQGGILVTASLVPSAWRRIFDLASAGKTSEALEVHRTLIPLMNMAFAETNPGPMKSVIDMIGVNAPDILAPLMRADATLERNLRAELAKQLEVFEKRG
jgi:4-hydroxy-tetrahydrodipicolinate synthase